jgi:hypothetical protein
MFCSHKANFADPDCGGKRSRNSIDFSISGYSREVLPPPPQTISSRSICVQMVEQGAVASVTGTQGSRERQNPWSDTENWEGTWSSQSSGLKGLVCCLFPISCLIYPSLLKMKATGSSKTSVAYMLHPRCTEDRKKSPWSESASEL